MSAHLPRRLEQALPYLIAAAMVGAAASLAYIGERWLAPQSLALFFVLPIILAAVAYGMKPALAASLLSVVAINYLFVEPRMTFLVARPQDLAALILLAGVGVVVSIVAERARAAEEARIEVSRERFKAELLASVSHDLRTPLATIIFTLQSLRKFAAGHDPETRAELLALAETEAARLAGLVDTLLSASRVEAGATPVHLEPTSVSDVVAAALREATTMGGGAAPEVSMPENLPLISADPALAVRTLFNVLRNAATHAGGATVTVSARVEAHHVIVEVADDGPGLGVDPERLFEKFVRGVPGDGRIPGLGLGLPLARSFMEAQSGTLSAASGAGGGAVFALRFRCWTTAARHGD